MTDIKQLVRKRGCIKAKLTTFKNFVNELQEKQLKDSSSITEVTLIDLSQRIQLINSAIQEFGEIQEQIECIVEEDKLDEEFNEREQFEKSFFATIALAKTLKPLESNQQGQATFQSTKNAEIKLPKIDLPVFKGTFEEWVSFRDTFTSIIHNNTNLSEIEKFHYLKASLQGDAIQVLQSLELTNSNYAIAWNLLTDRFENIRLIVQSHVRALFDLPAVSKESANKLRCLCDTLLKHLRALEALNQPTKSWNALIIHLLCSKLDPTTLREWESTNTSSHIPSLDELTTFLLKRCQWLEALEASKGNNIQQSKPGNYTPRVGAHAATVHHSGCIICNGPHSIYRCPTFLKLTISERIQKAKKLNLCTNCLRSNHYLKDCIASNCRNCSQKHNTLLHSDEFSKQYANRIKSEMNQSSETSTPQTSAAAVNTAQVLLSTALVIVYDSKGNPHDCKTLLDSGSQSHFITNKLVNKLNLTCTKINTPVAGIGDKITTLTQQTTVTIKSKYNAFKENLNCLVLPSIAGIVPNFKIDITTLNIPPTIKLADTTFHEPNEIDLLIGAELFYRLLSVGQIKLNRNQPLLQKTILGWIISGAYIPSEEQTSGTTRCNLSINNLKLEHQLERFWIQEEKQFERHFSKEETQCEEHFIRNTTRESNGRYVVALPFKQNHALIGDSYNTAHRRFLTLETKLERNIEHRTQYNQFMNEYKELGHMTEVSNVFEDATSTYYLPHHAVYKEASATTKIRVVFDGSAKTTTGVSLNDTLMVGPTIQDDLFIILLRFRIHKYVLTADIEKMYRQINIKDTDRKSQLILWRNNPQEPIKTYSLNTVTYGTSSAPFLAIRSLKQLAIDEEHNFPEAAKIIKSDFYVDDLITGTSEIEHAIVLQQQITELLAKGQFNIRKWRTNDSRILNHLHSTDDDILMKLDKQEIQKTLGLYWNAKEDTLLYSVKTTEFPKRVTKRNILSHIAQIYDPLGLIGPVLINAKLIMQELWKLKVEWDESVPLTIQTTWIEIYKGLHQLNHLRISRCVNSSKNSDLGAYQLHGFADASEKAYGASIYVRSTNGTNFKVELLCSKAKVAPVTKVNTPRLELSGAVLMAQLISKIRIILNIDINNTYCWTDSTIVLAWISKEPSQLKTFVANRIAEIQRSLPIKAWRHVSSKSNPADIISRGANPDELLNNELWWSGPDWLSQDENVWPNSPIDLNAERTATQDETKASIILVSSLNNNPFLNNYSSILKLQRITAYCLRFAHNSKISNKNNQLTGFLTNVELKQATIKILHLLQKQEFKQELCDLNNNETVFKQSKLRSLNPFIDETGLIRVGGRLRHSQYSNDKKHPIVLPANHHITNIIFQEEHVKRLHCGIQTLLAYIRLKYWPIKGKFLAKRVTKNCPTCSRFKPQMIQHVMGDLPASRIHQTLHPFTFCGVDYCGPFQIRVNRNRGPIKSTKGYIGVFVCFATKAVHLELISDLTAEAFLAALRRFTGRRGLPSKIHSDNGTNFVKANRELQELYTFLKNNKDIITAELTKQDITWSFIPPRSPHFGGLWEAAVKSIKHHLIRVIKNSVLTFEEFNTLIIQIEACLNSRPLTPLSNDPNDYSILTPSHFLIGDSLLMPVEATLTDIKDNLLTRWQYIQKLKQYFWQRWSVEYLHQLQQRTKWTRGEQQLQPGSLVLLMEDNLPPQKWSTGRVVETFAGQDNIVRVVNVKTSLGVFKRSVRKLCLLPNSEAN